METNKKSLFLIEELLNKIFEKENLSEEDKKKITEALNKELYEKPFRVAVIGQGGVGKSTTLNSVFGLENYTSQIAEGTTDIIEKTFPIRNGFNLSVYDMPGLNNDFRKDAVYEEMYKKILPDCDVIVYIINAHSKDYGEDCRILKDVILPICNANKITNNLIIALNKIDTIGETVDVKDPELKWNKATNIPSRKLKEAIAVKLNYIFDKLCEAGLVGNDDSFTQEQIVFYSAVYKYNLDEFLLAITKAGNRGWIWSATVGLENLGMLKEVTIKL